MRQDRVVEWALQTTLEIAVEVSQRQHLRPTLAAGVDMAFETNLRFGQRTGLVGAQHVHRAHVLNRRGPLDDDLERRHAQRAARQRHRHHHRQQLRCQTDGQRHGEQKRFEQRAMKGHIDQQREQHQQQGQAHDQHAKAPRADLERGGRRIGGQADCNLPQRRTAAGAPNQHTRRATDDRAAHEDAVAALERPVIIQRRGAVCQCGSYSLFYRKRLARELRLIDEKVVGLNEARVCGHQAAGRQQHQVARHQLRHRQFTSLAVAQHAGRHRHLECQLFRRAPGAIRLHEVQRHAHQHDGTDDESASEVTRECRNAGRHQQHQHQWVLEMRQELQHNRALRCRRQPIRSELLEALTGLDAAQSIAHHARQLTPIDAAGLCASAHAAHWERSSCYCG